MDTKYKKIDKCVGCGLCKSVFSDSVEMNIDPEGFYRPFFLKEYDERLMEKICPISHSSESYSSDIWGKYEEVYLGHSLSSEIREKGSSGGVITQSLVYLLENDIIDAVIHVGPSAQNPLKNETKLSFTKEEVIANAGSRYAPAAPLIDIEHYLKKDLRYAFVGKPCDIRGLRNYAQINKLVDERIIYTFSFFCMGTPSYKATDNLISELGLNNNKVSEFWYRGKGWPGFATAITEDGQEYSMSYNDSWGKILGKHIQNYCRWCGDGVGEFADISCGDAWYLDDNNKPRFDESEGRSVVFARNLKGKKLLEDMYIDKRMEIKSFSNDILQLKYMNYSQYKRKSTMLGKIFALKVLRKDTPKYRFSDLYSWSKKSSIYRNCRTFYGTLIRAWKGKF